MLNFIKTILATFSTEIVIGVFVAVLGAGGFLYVTFSQDKIAFLEQEQARQETTNKDFEQSLARIQADASEIRQRQEEVNTSMSHPHTVVRHRKTVKDIDRTALKKAAALEKKINAEMSETLKAFEDMSK